MGPPRQDLAKTAEAVKAAGGSAMLQDGGKTLAVADPDGACNVYSRACFCVPHSSTRPFVASVGCVHTERARRTAQLLRDHTAAQPRPFTPLS